MDLLYSTNDGRFILADAKLNNGHLSDDAQNTLTKLLINYLFQDKCRYYFVLLLLLIKRISYA